MDRLGVPWKYEALEPDISRAIRYMPDFWLPEQLAWLEIKSRRPSRGEYDAARRLRDATGRRVYLVWGWPGRGRFGLAVVSDAGEVETTRPDFAGLGLATLWDVGLGEVWGG